MWVSRDNGYRHVSLIAILLGEPEAEALARAISKDARRLISAFAALETGIVK